MSCWTTEQDERLLKFLIEKSETALSPLNVADLSREFVDTNSVLPTHFGVGNKILKIQKNLENMPHLSETIRENLNFALGNITTLKHSPWTEAEIIDLQKFIQDKSNESETLNYASLSREYAMSQRTNRSDRSVNMKIIELRRRFHAMKAPWKAILKIHPNPDLPDIIAPILDFLAEISENRETPMSDSMFLMEYNRRGVPSAHRISNSLYLSAKNRIALAEKFDEKTKVKMMFVSNAPLGSSILSKYRENALVELDGKKRIHLYMSFDGNLNLERNVSKEFIHESRKRLMTSSDTKELKIPKIEKKIKEEEEPDF